MPKEEIDVRYVANLCRLELSETEAARYQAQLEQVLAYMGQIDNLDVAGIEPTAHAAPVFDVWREDEVRPGLSREDALLNAPQEAQNQFAITKVVE